MVNIELRLFAKMLQSGDFTPIQTGEITAESCSTEQGLIVYNFITGYRSATDGAAKYPSLSVVRSRFMNSMLDLPDPDPGDTLPALVYEAQTQRMRGRIQEMAVELDTLSKSSDDLVTSLMKKQAEMRKMTDKLQHAKHVSLASGFEDVVADYDNGSIITEGIPWMWPSLQKATRGKQKGDFVIIAGRPKSRKTFTALAAGVHAMLHWHARVLVFSPEMKRRMMLLRAIAFLCSLRYTEFKESSMSDPEELRLIEAARRYGRWPGEDDEQYAFRLHSTIPGLPDHALPSIDIIESTGRSVSWMESQIEMFQPDIVIADSFYRQTADGQKRNDIDHKVMTMLSRNLKDLAMNSNVVMIGTHQLNREADNKVGSLSNLGYSDAFGQDMDLGFRVITGKMKDDKGNLKEVSAIVVLGGREVPFEGILINNVPCCDFSEIGPIVSRKTVATLLKQEEEEDAKEEAEATKKRAGTLGHKQHKNLTKAAQKAAVSHNKDFGIDEKEEDEDEPSPAEGEAEA